MNVTQYSSSLIDSLTLVLISVPPQRKKTIDPEVDSGVLPSSKPIPASAILTFVPDNEVKKIVTRPQVENTSSLNAEKQMVLRDRRTAAGQDSLYSRRKSVVLCDDDTDGDAKSLDGAQPTSSLDTVLVKEESHGKDSAQVPSKEEEEGSTTEMCAVEETGKESKMPSEIKNVIKNEGENSTDASIDSTISDKHAVENSSSKNETDEPINVSRNGMNTQASSIKTELPSSSLANNSSVGLPASTASEVKDGKSVTVFSSGAASNQQLNAAQTSSAGNSVPTAKQEVEQAVFRLGSEANYSSYVNQFTSNPLALTKQQQLEQRDKKRSVTHKFHLNEVKWHGEVCGSKEVILNTLRFSIVSLENSIASSFMHPTWPGQRSTWVKAVHLSKTPQEFAAALSLLESSIRPICYLSVWNDAVGHVELHRVMSEARQVGTKKKDHKEEEEEPEVESKGFGKLASLYLNRYKAGLLFRVDAPVSLIFTPVTNYRHVHL